MALKVEEICATSRKRFRKLMSKMTSKLGSFMTLPRSSIPENQGKRMLRKAITIHFLEGWVDAKDGKEPGLFCETIFH